MVSVYYRCFYVPKAGHTGDQYEDAFAPDQPGRFRIESRWLCGLADGASEGGFSRRWANLLVKRLTAMLDEDSLTPQTLQRYLAACVDEWQQEIVPELIREYGSSSRFYAIQQSLLLTGSAATLAMIEVDPTVRRWRGISLGDSCIFHIRDGKILDYLPKTITRASDFDTSPLLVSTQPDRMGVIREQLEREALYLYATYKPGDVLLLMTDALAEWFIRQCEHSNPQLIVSELYRINSDTHFQQMIDELRREQALKNDDTTLLMIQIDGRPLFPALETQAVSSAVDELPPVPKTLLQRHPKRFVGASIVLLAILLCSVWIFATEFADTPEATIPPPTETLIVESESFTPPGIASSPEPTDTIIATITLTTTGVPTTILTSTPTPTSTTNPTLSLTPDFTDLRQGCQDAGCFEEYPVASGDTLANIADRLSNVDVERISAVSNIPDVDTIDVGDILCLPDYPFRFACER